MLMILKTTASHNMTNGMWSGTICGLAQWKVDDIEGEDEVDQAEISLVSGDYT